MTIYPKTLQDFLESCTDAESVGRVCMAIGGHKVDLNPLEKAFVEMIGKASDSMEDKMNERREKERLRKARYRSGLSVTGSEDGDEDAHASPAQSNPVPSCPAVSRGVPPSPAPDRQSDRQTDNQTDSVCVSTTHSRVETVGTPSEKVVVSVATSVMGVSEEYARWWYAEMVARDWKNTNGMSISNSNWRPVLKTWWNKRTAAEESAASELSSKKRIEEKVYPPEAWTLCEERCANCDGSRCMAGVRVPPAHASPPYPPNDCGRFKPKQ